MKKSIRTLTIAFALVILSGNTLVAEAKVTIKHNPISSVLSGHRTNVTADIKDETHGIDIVRVYFKTAEESRYFFVALSKSEGDTYIGTLPAAELGAGVMDYLILVKNSADEVVKSQNYTINVKDDPEALARLEEKPARDLRIEATCMSGSKQMYRQVKSASKWIKKKEDKEADEPTHEMWIPICSEYDKTPKKVTGVDDYVTVAGVSAAEKYGVVAGIVDAQAAGSVSTSGLTSGGTVAAKRKIPIEAIAGGAAAVIVLSGSSGGGGGGSSSGGGTQLLPTITPPNGPGSQLAPLSMEFNEFAGVAVPISVTYDGTPMGAGSGTVPALGTLTIAQPAVGGLIRVTLTANVTGASLQFHFNSGGGRSPTPITGHPITGSAGDYILLQTQ